MNNYITETVPEVRKYKFFFDNGKMRETLAVDPRSASINMKQWMDDNNISVAAIVAIEEWPIQVQSIAIH